MICQRNRQRLSVKRVMVSKSCDKKSHSLNKIKPSRDTEKNENRQNELRMDSEIKPQLLLNPLATRDLIKVEECPSQHEFSQEASKV